MTERLKRESHKAAQRREEILDAALVCFREKGFHAASMSSIAKAFGMSAGHIYNYFDSKESIIAALVDRWVNDYISRRPFPIEIDPRLQYEQLLGQVQREIRELVENCDKALLFEIAAESLRNEKIAASIRRASAIAQQYIRENVVRRYEALGREPPSDLDARIVIPSAIFDGICLRSVVNPSFSLEDLAPVVAQLLLHLENMPDTKAGN